MPKKLFYLVFAVVAVGILAAIHYYLWLRLVAQPLWAAGPALTVLVAALAATIPLTFAGERLVPPPLGRVLVWPGAIWMGLAWLLFAQLVLSDLALGLPGLLADPASARVRALVVLGLGALGVAVGLRGALRVPPVKFVTVHLPRWPAALDGYRVVQLSDLHVGPILTRRWLERVVRRVNAIDADCVVVTGDLIDGPARHFEADLAPFDGVRARNGVYGVTGNHELYSGPHDWLEVFERHGVTVLANTHRTLGRGDARFDLAGTHDRQGALAHLPEDLDQALAGRDPSRPVILLAHTPTTFPDAAARGVDLTLSGHTHGGQIWPFGFLVRLAMRYVAGLYRSGKSQLYVSRGTGFWGPPMRLGAPSEITEITLRAG
ncbi:MAG: metallophosphoesterase [Deltaproteobacteria bacterium]|nr:MAG: metallophosphoesterase [Deltaproteobacteria bacterium]